MIQKTYNQSDGVHLEHTDYKIKKVIKLTNQLNCIFTSNKMEKNFLCQTMKDFSALQNDKKATKVVKSFEKVQIQVKNQILDDLLQVYSWRSKTQLPIVKVLFYKVKQRDMDQFLTTMQVSYEWCSLTLSNINDLSISNLLYLLRQSMIGFQKLFSVFGSFLISNKMIGINKNNRCKVWINQNFAVNQPIDVEIFKNLSQKDFLSQLIQIFKKKTQRNKLTFMLFNEISSCEKFLNAVESLEKFSKNYKIQINNCYRAQQNSTRKENPSKSPIKNPFQMTMNSFIGEKGKKVPQFLNKSQISQTNNLNNYFLTTSRISSRPEKSKSNTKNIVRERTPLIHNRSQMNLCNLSKSPLKAGFKTFQKEDQASKLDYSFENKYNSCSPLIKKKTSLMIESTNSISRFQIKNLHETQKKSCFQPKQVIKSDVNTTHTNNSAITSKTIQLLQKRQSIFEADRDLIQSIVIGNEHQKPRTNLFSTHDLQHLGKLGKNVVQSCMPEDFKS